MCKETMKRILDYAMSDTVMDVTGQIYVQARRKGLGLGEHMFREMLGAVLPPAVLPSVEAFKARMQEDETRQRFVKLYDATTDNQRKGVICRIFDAAGLDGRLLMRGY